MERGLEKGLEGGEVAGTARKELFLEGVKVMEGGVGG